MAPCQAAQINSVLGWESIFSVVFNLTLQTLCISVNNRVVDVLIFIYFVAVTEYMARRSDIMEEQLIWAQGLR